MTDELKTGEGRPCPRCIESKTKLAMECQAIGHKAGYLAALGDVEKKFRQLYLTYCREPGNTNPEHTTDWTTPLWGELEKIFNKLKSRAGEEDK